MHVLYVSEITADAYRADRWALVKSPTIALIARAAALVAVVTGQEVHLQQDPGGENLDCFLPE